MQTITDGICIACKETKSYLLDMNDSTINIKSAICLDCLEYIYAKTSLYDIEKLKKDLKELQELREGMKIEKKKLKDLIMKEKDRKKIYQFKVELNQLRARRIELKEEEKELSERIESILTMETLNTNSIPPRESFVAKKVPNGYLWDFNKEESSIISEVGGNIMCKKCDVLSSNIRCSGSRYLCSFCIQCIRTLFEEMKITKKDFENAIKKLEEEEEKETNIFEDAKKKRQEEKIRFQEMLLNHCCFE
jgi:hypothetical protein